MLKYLQTIKRKKTLIIGLGGAGSNIVSSLPLPKDISTLVVNTDANSLPITDSTKTLTIGKNICNGHSANTRHIGEMAVKESASEIEKFISVYKYIFIIAGLGGGTGSGAIPEIIDLARKNCKHITTIAVIPFKFESKRRSIADSTLEILEQKSINLLIFDNEDLLDDKNRHLSLEECFESSNQRIYNCLHKLI